MSQNLQSTTLQSPSIQQVHLAADIALQARQAAGPLVVALEGLASSLDVPPVADGLPEDAIPAAVRAPAAVRSVDLLQRRPMYFS